jgi:NAD(P)-dependent dehydrogenase (short-subunit alcohol dehydrogenase family)
MKRKVCLVTGASSGIGKATAIGLARLDATVVAVMRDCEKSSLALKEIKKKSNRDDASVIMLKADLASQKSLRHLAQEFNARFDRLDVLINNAGISRRKRNMTEDGIETVFAVNVLAPFLLTGLLLEKLKSSAPSRIVNVSAAAASWARIDFDNLQGEKEYAFWGIYSRSKLALNLITVEFARRLAGTKVTANFLHPGIIRTNLVSGNFNLAARAFAGFFGLFMASPEAGARTSIYLASAPEVGDISAKYFVNRKEKKANPISYDESTAKRLWQVCEQLRGLPAGGPGLDKGILDPNGR